MNVDHHAVSLVAVNRRRHHHQRVAANKVADASLLLEALAAGVGEQVELEGVGGADEQQKAAEPPHGREGLGRHWPFFGFLGEFAGGGKNKIRSSDASQIQSAAGIGEDKHVCFLFSML